MILCSFILHLIDYHHKDVPADYVRVMLIVPNIV